MGQKVNLNLLRLRNKENKGFFIKHNSKNNEENALFFFQNILIETFLKKIFKKLKVFIKNLRIYQSNSFIFIFVSFMTTNNMERGKKKKIYIKDISFIIKIIEALKRYTNNKTNFFFVFQSVKHCFYKLKQIFKLKFLFKSIQKRFRILIKKYKKYNQFFKDIVYLLLATSKKKITAQLIADYLSFVLSYKRFKKCHWNFLNLLKKLSSTLQKYNLFNSLKLKIAFKGRINGRNRAKSIFFNHHSEIPVNTLKLNINYASSNAFTPNGTLGIKIWIYEIKTLYYKKMTEWLKVIDCKSIGYLLRRFESYSF